jgi:hypothetical protein
MKLDSATTFALRDMVCPAWRSINVMRKIVSDGKRS